MGGGGGEERETSNTKSCKKKKKESKFLEKEAKLRFFLEQNTSVSEERHEGAIREGKNQKSGGGRDDRITDLEEGSGDKDRMQVQ